jgi:cytochrome P450
MADARESGDIPTVALAEAFWSERGRTLARLYGQHGPVFRARYLKTEALFLIGPEANRFVLADHRHAFSHRQGWSRVFGPGSGVPHLLSMDPPEHNLHRRILAPAFAARHLDAHLPLIAEVVEGQLVSWAARGEVDAYEEARSIAFDLAARAFLGLRSGPELELARAVYLHGTRGRASAFNALLRRAFAERRARPIGDAMGLLAQARDERGWVVSDEQLRSHAEILLVAGYETTASLGAWALYLLAAHPEYQELARAEAVQAPPIGEATVETYRRMLALDRALYEAERLYPPVPIVPRGLLRDVAFDGRLLEAGALAFYSPAATHLLPDLWPDPHRFDPDRFVPPREERRRVPFGLVGFGGGPRICIGLPFARLELLVLLAEVVRRYRLSPVPNQVLAQRYGVTSRPAHGIRLVVQPG